MIPESFADFRGFISLCQERQAGFYPFLCLTFKTAKGSSGMTLNCNFKGRLIGQYVLYRMLTAKLTLPPLSSYPYKIE